MYKAEIVAYSKPKYGSPLISYLITFPRIVLAENNTHRQFSRNTSSSRAISLDKMIQSVEKEPFIPIAFQRKHKGMQGSEYFNNKADVENLIDLWLQGRDFSVATAKKMKEYGVTKQLVNRLLEPFMWTTVLLTTTVDDKGLFNFFKLRCPNFESFDTDDRLYWSTNEFIENEIDADLSKFDHSLGDNLAGLWNINSGYADIHISRIAELMYDEFRKATPKKLKPNEWHIPFEDKIRSNYSIPKHYESDDIESLIMVISVAMAARTSYTLIDDEKRMTISDYISLYEKLVEADPPHSSVFEHCAKSMTLWEYLTNINGNIFKRSSYGWNRNFRGFIQLRHFFENKKDNK